MNFPPALDEWDEEFLLEVAAADESLDLEKKASPALDPPDWAKLYKHVCAFANAAGGYLVYGIDKKKQFDGGVPMLHNRTDMADVVSQHITQGLQPELRGCRVRPIPLRHHAPGRCVMVVQIPLSESRPHWVKGGNEPRYLRADRHSNPMSLQTFLDIKTRATAGVAVIESLGVWRGPEEGNAGEVLYYISPRVQLLNGPVCEHWCFELIIPEEAGRLWINSGRWGRAVVEPGGGRLFIQSDQLPLYRGRLTTVLEAKIKLTLTIEKIAKKAMTATLHAGSAEPVVTIPLDEFYKAPQSW